MRTNASNVEQLNVYIYTIYIDVDIVLDAHVKAENQFGWLMSCMAERDDMLLSAYCCLYQRRTCISIWVAE